MDLVKDPRDTGSSNETAHLTMKQIIAIVKPFLAEKVLESLRLAPLEALYVREVKGYGRQKNSLDRYGDSEFSMAFLPKVEITMWVDDQRAEEIVRKVEKVARTGRIGDGKIVVLSGLEPEQTINMDDTKTKATR